MNAAEQTVAELESRLTKGAALLWSDERAGITDSPRYEERLRLFESLLAVYATKCHEDQSSVRGDAA